MSGWCSLSCNPKTSLRREDSGLIIIFYRALRISIFFSCPEFFFQKRGDNSFSGSPSLFLLATSQREAKRRET
jgi:hypothetical protein